MNNAPKKNDITHLGSQGAEKSAQMRENLTSLPITALSTNNDVLFVASGKYLLIYRKNSLREISRFSHFQYAINGISQISDESVAIWSRGTLLKFGDLHFFFSFERNRQTSLYFYIHSS